MMELGRNCIMLRGGSFVCTRLTLSKMAVAVKSSSGFVPERPDTFEQSCSFVIIFLSENPRGNPPAKKSDYLGWICLIDKKYGYYRTTVQCIAVLHRHSQTFDRLFPHLVTFCECYYHDPSRAKCCCSVSNASQVNYGAETD